MSDALRRCPCGDLLLHHDVEDSDGGNPLCGVEGCDQRGCRGPEADQIEVAKVEADLARVKRERDWEYEQRLILAAGLNGTRTERDALQAELDSLARRYTIRHQEAEKLRAEVAFASAELESWRGHAKAHRAEAERLERLLVERHAELAAAHAEIEQLDRDLKLCPRCGVEVDAEINGDPNPTEGAPPA